LNLTVIIDILTYLIHVTQTQYINFSYIGALRTVTYTADAVNGFNAVVSRSAPQVAHHVAKVAVAPVRVAHQPIAVAHHAAPIGYAGLGAVGYGGVAIGHAAGLGYAGHLHH
jgi:hypothetical protein